MKPVIGLTVSVQDDGSVSLLEAYSRAIENAGGIPILIPYVKNTDIYNDFIELCDGIFITGGADIDPHRYGESKKNTCGAIQRLRDETELYVLCEALCRNKPILAVCRGTQLLNVYLGGTLYQDIPTEYPSKINHVQDEGRFEPSHSVKIADGSPLSKLVGKDVMTANSFHHQAIKNVGKDLVPMAYAEDGIIEAVYLPSKAYVRGYQWHPERIFDTDTDNRKIFLDFINACNKEREK